MTKFKSPIDEQKKCVGDAEVVALEVGGEGVGTVEVFIDLRDVRGREGRHT